MRRLIDLSMPIRLDHFRWRPEQRLQRSHEKGDGMQSTWLGCPVHAFTHMDTPRHFDPAGSTTDALSLDMVAGEAAVVDVQAAGANAPITAALVRAAGAHVREGDIVLMRAGWDRVESVDTPEFWTRAPYMTTEACEWLLARGIVTIAPFLLLYAAGLGYVGFSTLGEGARARTRSRAAQEEG